MQIITTLIAPFLLLVAAQTVIAADPQPTVKLDGTWLFDAAKFGKQDSLNRVWASVVTINGDRFELSKLMGHSKNLTGKIVFDPTDKRAVDLVLDELDFTEIGAPIKIESGTHRGIFEANGDRLTICLNNKPDEARPTKFEASEATHLITLALAPVGFKDFPKEITIRVTGPDEKPVVGAKAATWMGKQLESPKKSTAPVEWHLSDSAATDSEGTVKAKYDRLPVVIRDENSKLIAYPVATPAQLASGELKVVLGPECRVTGKIVSEELTKAGGKIAWTNVYLNREGRRVASCGSFETGAFDFVVTPGVYTLYAYGEELPRKEVTITVPPNRSEYAVEPINLKASAFAFLKGKPAPEFIDVVGWVGKPVKLADLKGQYVLVDFWGYWCGPCVAAMPVLIELHEKFHDKGLAIIGIHVDGDGEVATAEQFNAKNAGYVQDAWKGKELPFPNALVSGARVGEGEDRGRGGVPKQYGVLSYPTTILIDPEGKVVGAFHARDIKAATAMIEKLLASKK